LETLQVPAAAHRVERVVGPAVATVLEVPAAAVREAS
jgi:hypothetical protein